MKKKAKISALRPELTLCDFSLVADSRPVVISGPSGSGKSTLISKLFYEYPSTFGFSVSHTTRLPRPGEQDGIAYHFISPSTMSELISQQDPRFFLEHAVFSGNHYGTSKKAVQDVINSGKICILDIDLQGVRSVRESGLDARYVFVRPRGLEVLERRLRGRGTETEEAIRKRLEIARAEWTEGLEGGMFDCVVVNGELEEAYRDLRDYIFSPRRS
ncbi:P-loop containing nucleoside triphosphate hydrolase protein [Gamsiella multidivaricata]|uniref:P-loop containing nucleoside triphosphate hydrolase protein n=1 Tax=Gamsiella multidivaricata TaxID=101098 RepID=UPI00221FC61D|nr:P-loop containing nucleoside triphosphate hydrolase protein [Gamsiella multidivaricata]KAI7817758.1 P-loop containing nucleoside triphosphate hydrolase protein [Gamsiella multidivaricata]